MRRSIVLACTVLVAAASAAALPVPAGAASSRAPASRHVLHPRPFPGGHVVQRLAVTVRDERLLSGGARMWFRPPQPSGEEGGAKAAAVSYGSNVDANDPAHDLAPGQA